MEKSIYRYILKYTRRDQLFLILLTAISMPFIYYGLEIPKLVINNALGGEGVPSEFLGIEIDRLQFLLLLCFAYLLLAIVNGGLKYIMNVYRGSLGERMLRRFRYTLYNRILRFPLARFKRVSSGEIIPMITAETEPLGGFIGDSIALPVFQGGLLVTYLFFIFNQGVWLGIVAIALFPPQMIIIPKLQRKVNELARQRVQNVRKLADHVGESVAGVGDIHSHYTRRYEQATISDRLGKIYDIRLDIYKRKFFIKFLNNFLSVLTPFFFYSIGGYLVLQGELSLGALVAVLAAYKDLDSPWKELLKFYQISQDIKVKYAQIIEQFDLPNMFDLKVVDDIPENIEPFKESLVTRNLSYVDEDDNRIIDRISTQLPLDQHIAVTGKGSSDTGTFTHLLARLINPAGGQVLIDNNDTREIPEAVLGQRFAYSGSDSHIFNCSITDNLLYGLKHQPVPEWDKTGDDNMADRDSLIKEAIASGNSTDDPHANWIDYRASGASDYESFKQLINQVLETLEIDDEAFELGLTETVDLERHPELADQVIKIRKEIAGELNKPKNTSLVEFFDTDQYNENLSVAENVIFGAPLTDDYQFDCLSYNELINGLLKEQGLDRIFLETGYRLTETMLELFADLSEDDELFEQFSFIRAEDFPEYERIRAEVEKRGLDKLSSNDCQMLVAMTYKLTPARHRLGLIDNSIQPLILNVRKTLREKLGEDNDHITFFDINKYNPAVSIQDNIVFGRISYGLARAQRSIKELIEKAVNKSGFRTEITWSGLDFIAGPGGTRLSLIQRQKIMVARCLFKNPDILIINDTLSALNPTSQARILDSIIEFRKGKNLIWTLDNPDLESRFDTILAIESGKLV
jgi:putative ABC transport system ATP-binding protein